jgi:hypothetical protein
MVPGEPSWICRKCGRRSEMAVAPDTSGRCERCLETAGFEPSNQPLPTGAGAAFPFLEEIVDDALRRLVVARLRARYSEARGLVTPVEPHSPSHANLDWILGARRGPDQNYVSFDERFSELVVLWLEDLVLELDGPLLAPYSPGVVPSEVPAGVSRESAALGLRVATRDFADAFLGRRDPVGGP